MSATRRELLLWVAASAAACERSAGSPEAPPSPAATVSPPGSASPSAAHSGVAPGAARLPEGMQLSESLPAATQLTSAHPRIAARWQALIDEAERELALCHFYVSEKAPSALTPVLAALRRAAARRLQVRLLVDAKMAETYPQPIGQLGSVIEVRRLDAGAAMGGVQHAKYMLADRRKLWLGSANCDWRALDHIHELGLELASPALAGALQDVFERDWALAGGEPLPAPRAEPVAPVTLGDLRLRLALSPRAHLPHPDSWDLPQLEQLIAGARADLRLQLLSLQPSYRDGRPFRRLHDALVAAAKRGVRVRVLLSHWETRADHIDSLKQLRRDGIDLRLCTIPAHPQGFIPFARVVHAKYLVADADASWVGTSNFSGDYFEHSRNVGVVAAGASLAKQLIGVFTRMWDSPYSAPLDPARDYPEPRISE